MHMRKLCVTCCSHEFLIVWSVNFQIRKISAKAIRVHYLGKFATREISPFYGMVYKVLFL